MRTRQIWRGALPMLAALSLTMMCAGCATSAPATAPRLGTDLPPRPAWMAEVPVSAERVGQDSRDLLAVRTGELVEANARLRRSGPWYDDVRAEAARGGGQ